MYGVAIDVSFDVFPFTGVEFKSSLHGAMKLALARDGSATGATTKLPEDAIVCTAEDLLSSECR